nr:histidine kinase [Auritidibacter ignavus]
MPDARPLAPSSRDQCGHSEFIGPGSGRPLGRDCRGAYSEFSPSFLGRYRHLSCVGVGGDERTARRGQECERVSRDLHDVLGSSATTIALKAQLSAEFISRSDQHRALAEIEDISRLATTISRDTREAVRNLRETTLEAELLVAQATAKAAGIRCDIRRAGTPEAQCEPVLAMIIRESVTNAARHADASLISVTVEAGGVEIADDGHGGKLVAGDGIRGMKDRLSACGGTLSVNGGQNQGTVVTARLP